MKIKIWGARGSIPSPLKPEEVQEKIYQAILGTDNLDTTDPVAVRQYVKTLPPLVGGTAGGNTACVEIQAENQMIIIDAGSGIRELGLELMNGPCGRGEGVLHLLFSHAHWDHIQGFPFFRPAFVPGNKLFIYSVHDLKTVLTEQQQFINFPVPLSYMQATREFITIIPEQPFTIGDVKINTIETVHPGKAYAFRFDDEYSTFVFASDAEYKNLDQEHLQPYIDFFRNADALIFDTQFTLGEALEKVDWGHSSAMIGADLARAAAVKKMILFHHDPTYSDATLEDIQKNTIKYQAQSSAGPRCEVVVAYEGLTIDLTPAGAVSVELLTEREAAVLTPTNIFDERGVGRLELQLSRLRDMDGTTGSIIDLSQVETLTTASLKALISLRREQQGADMVLASASPHVREVIELAGFEDFFAIYSTVEAAAAALQARKSLNLPGQLIKERYQIEKKLNDGRLGAILKATDLTNNRPVTVKILSASFSDKAVDRVLRQAQQMINLRHINMVDVFDCGRISGFAFIIEEFVEGKTLDLILADHEPLDPPEALEIGLQITRVLEHAHSRGKIHGDLQSKNIVLCTPSETGPKSVRRNKRLTNETLIKVKRFGMGWLEEGLNLLERPLALLSAAYLAPEQILGHPLDARTDLYTLGILLYELFTGHHPFSGKDDREIMEAHLHQQPQPLREINPRLSNGLEHFILKLLAKNPNERYANAQQAYHILQSLVVYKGQLDTPVATPQRLRPFVGRQEELQQLLAGWQQTIAGQGQLFFVIGETGIGKTRLGQELAKNIQGGVVLTGHCEDWEGVPPYRPIIEILQAYFSTVPPEVIDTHDELLLAELTRLVPDIHKLLPDLPEITPLEPKQEQLRIMSTVTQFITWATTIRPWLIILEDLHWIDESSLHMLTHLARKCPDMSLMIIGTYRDTDLSIDHPLLNALRSLSRQPSYQTISLERLDKDEVGEMLTGLLGQEEHAPSGVVDRIYQRTEGNPVYVEEVVSGLVDEGVISRGPDGWDFSRLAEINLPQSVRDAVLYRIKSLSKDTQRLLRQAAVLGRTFKFGDLQAMSGLTEWEVLERLDIALERQLVHEVLGETMLSFNHAEIQQVLYEEMSQLRRRALHLRAGEAVEQQTRPDPLTGLKSERIVEQLAYHYGKAGKFEQAIVYSVEAARLAETTYANQTALHWYQRVLDMVGQLDPKRSVEFRTFALAAHEAMGKLLIVLGRYEAALEQYDQARTLVENEEHSVEQMRRLADLSRKTARIFKKQGRFEAGLEWIQKGLRYLDENEPTIEVASIYILGAEIYYYQGYYHKAIEWCKKGLESASQLHNRAGRQAVAQAYCLLGSSHRGLGALNQAADLCQQGVAAYEDLNDMEGLSRAFILLAEVYLDQAKWDQAAEILQQSLSMKQEIGDTLEQGQAFSKLGDVKLYISDYEKATELYQQSLAIWKQVGSPFFEASVLNKLAKVALLQDELADAETYLKQSEQLLANVNSEKLTPELRRSWAEFYLKSNRLDEALNVIQRAIDLSKSQKSLLEQGISERILGQVYHTRHNDELAKKTLQHSFQILSNLPSDYEAAKTMLTMVEIGAGEKTLPELIETFRRLGAKADLAKALALREGEGIVSRS